MTNLPDKDAVLEEAMRLLDDNPGMSYTQSVKDALRAFYGLVPGDGIHGDSPAAINLGYPRRHEDEDLWDEVVSDLIDAVNILWREGRRAKKAVPAPKGRPNPLVERWL